MSDNEKRLRDEYIAALDADNARLTSERDAARAFISDLVHMQSSNGWTRAVIREAAAEFLGKDVLPAKDTTPAFVMLAEVKAENARLRAALRPFKELADEIEHCAAQFPEGVPERDPDSWVMGCTWPDLVRAREALKERT